MATNPFTRIVSNRKEEAEKALAAEKAEHAAKADDGRLHVDLSHPSNGHATTETPPPTAAQGVSEVTHQGTATAAPLHNLATDAVREAAAARLSHDPVQSGSTTDSATQQTQVHRADEATLATNLHHDAGTSSDTGDNHTKSGDDPAASTGLPDTGHREGLRFNDGFANAEQSAEEHSAAASNINPVADGVEKFAAVTGVVGTLGGVATAGGAANAIGQAAGSVVLNAAIATGADGAAGAAAAAGTAAAGTAAAGVVIAAGAGVAAGLVVDAAFKDEFATAQQAAADKLNPTDTKEQTEAKADQGRQEGNERKVAREDPNGTSTENGPERSTPPADQTPADPPPTDQTPTDGTPADPNDPSAPAPDDPNSPSDPDDPNGQSQEPATGSAEPSSGSGGEDFQNQQSIEPDPSDPNGQSLGQPDNGPSTDPADDGQSVGTPDTGTNTAPGSEDDPNDPNGQSHGTPDTGSDTTGGGATDGSGGSEGDPNDPNGQSVGTPDTGSNTTDSGGSEGDPNDPNGQSVGSPDTGTSSDEDGQSQAPSAAQTGDPGGDGGNPAFEDRPANLPNFGDLVSRLGSQAAFGHGAQPDTNPDADQSGAATGPVSAGTIVSNTGIGGENQKLGDPGSAGGVSDGSGGGHGTIGSLNGGSPEPPGDAQGGVIQGDNNTTHGATHETQPGGEHFGPSGSLGATAPHSSSTSTSSDGDDDKSSSTIPVHSAFTVPETFEPVHHFATIGSDNNDNDDDN